MKQLLPNAEYEFGDIVDIGGGTCRVVRGGITDDLTWFEGCKHLITNPFRVHHLHESWTAGTVWFSMPLNKETQ